MDTADSEVPEDPKSKTKVKKVKEKKRPSDFEIVRTILQRTHERKLPYILKNLGEDPDILLMVSVNEKEFFYGYPKITIAMYQFHDPELKALVDGLLSRMYGTDSEHQLLINIRDQISELAKTKGESMDITPEVNDLGRVWLDKPDAKGGIRTTDYVLAIDSLFHFQSVQNWMRDYRDLLTTQDPAHLYIPYTYPTKETYGTVHLTMDEYQDHPIAKLFPHGFRQAITKGFDVFVSNAMTEIPYPVTREEFVVKQVDVGACQLIHRIVGEGWSAILTRPNSVHFAPASVSL